MPTKSPKTPFSTRLSGNARETELRLRSIFQWQKKRPPMILFVLVLLLTVSCGGLVSCRQAGNEEVWHLGCNADILDIDEENRILYVCDSGEQYEVFGQWCALACGKAEEEGRLIYVDYETSELTRIPFEEFQVGDSIMVALTESQYQAARDASAQVMQIQLGTQRDIKTNKVLEQMYTAASMSDVVEKPSMTLLLPPEEEGLSLAAGRFYASERQEYELVIGVWNAETESFQGQFFRAMTMDNPPRVVGFEVDGRQRLLYTANSVYEGRTGGQAGVIELTDAEMNWVWPVKGDVRVQASRDESGQPYTDYLEYWTTHKALLCPNGVEVFKLSPDYVPGQNTTRQWVPEEELYFYVTDHNVVNSDLLQARAWLEEYAREIDAPINVTDPSAAWRILSLRRNGGERECTLLCSAENHDNQYLRARLRIDHFQQEPLEFISCETGISTPEALAEEAYGIDRTMLARLGDFLDAEFRTRCAQEESTYVDMPESPHFNGGEVITLWPLREYDDLFPGSTAILYEFEMGLTCEYPERVEWVDGNWLDGQNRVRNGYSAAYLVVEERDGQIVAADILGQPSETEQEGINYRQMTQTALERARSREEQRASGEAYRLREIPLKFYDHGAYLMDSTVDLSTTKRNWLADLPVAELPKEAVQLREVTSADLWRDLLIPLAYDEKADVTIYGVLSGTYVFQKSDIPLELYDLDSGGVVIRCGNKAAYYPLQWGEHLWSGSNPELHVNDFDGDGKDEAGVVFLVGHGTGCSVRQLYFFDLDTLIYNVPTFANLDIKVSFDSETGQATLTGGAHSVTVEVPEEIRDFESVKCGTIVDYSYEDGQFYFNAGLDFYRTLAYLAEVKAPMVYEDGQYWLGEITSLTAIN